jgi:NhaA family Na+:H+ antiporter
MTDHALLRDSVTTAALARPNPRRSVSQTALRQFLLLPLGVTIALVWANTAPASYFRLSHALAFPVNEIGMAAFLALITQQALEVVMPGGALHSWRGWTLPVIAAAGGIAGAASTYVALVQAWNEPVLASAWLIPCAIDVAAAYYLVRLIYRRGTPLAFVLLVSFLTDAAMVALLALRPALTARRAEGFVLIAVAATMAAVMRRAAIRRFWPYFLLAGTLSWAGCYLADVHPALALVPIVPFLPHRPRGLDVFRDPRPDDPVHEAEHEWSGVVQGVLFLFGFVNAGVALHAFDTGSWTVMIAALAGRPAGLLAAAGLAGAVGLPLPTGMRWRDMVVVALATSCGFTLALFFARGVLPIGAVQQQVTLGALGTIVGAAGTLMAARLTGAGRFARTGSRRT